ncbi:MAG: GNAT family N-acetyltransferase [Acidobacteria bacterium]|mgnify:FL=1|jgi:RimJ/RimL family protein N-acetyltransferase|nr:GNAT family N-acetyltransferase [Acidobacteriota bacterium]
MELKLKTCIIRRWRPSDKTSLLRHANSYQIWRNVRDRFPHPYTAADADQWLTLAEAEEIPTNFAIVVDGEAVGGIGLVFRDDIHRCRAEIGYWLGETFWGRGITSEAVRALTAWAFDTFDIHSIYAGVLAWNPASARVLEKAGYQLEARLRKAVIKENQVMDEIVYAVVREESYE